MVVLFPLPLKLEPITFQRAYVRFTDIMYTTRVHLSDFIGETDDVFRHYTKAVRLYNHVFTFHRSLFYNQNQNDVRPATVRQYMKQPNVKTISISVWVKTSWMRKVY